MLNRESQIYAAAARKATGVSSECMERVYVMLRGLSDDHLKRMWAEARYDKPQDALIRAQIAYVFEKRAKGEWLQP